MAKQAPVPEPLLLAQKVVGQTGLSKYASCPRDYYLYRQHPAQSHAMTRGIVFHGGIDQLTKWMIEEGEEHVSGDVAREWVEGYLFDHPEYVLPEAERNALRGMAWNWGEATVLDLEHLLGSEIGITMELDGWLLRCQIDLVYGYEDHIDIRDYKTSLAMDSDEQVQQSFQGKFYSLACLEGQVENQPLPLGAGLNDTNFSLVYPRYRDKEHGHLKSRGAAFDRKDLQDFKVGLSDWLARLERSYEIQDWPAVPGSHCDRCAARALCPIKPELRDEVLVSSEAEARDAAELLWALDRDKARVQKVVRAWVAENGPVFFGADLAYDISSTESRSVRDWPALERGVMRAVEFGEPFRIEDYRQVRHGTRFGKRKQTSDERGGKA